VETSNGAGDGVEGRAVLGDGGKEKPFLIAPGDWARGINSGGEVAGAVKGDNEADRKGAIRNCNFGGGACAGAVWAISSLSWDAVSRRRSFGRGGFPGGRGDGGRGEWGWVGVDMKSAERGEGLGEEGADEGRREDRPVGPPGFSSPAPFCRGSSSLDPLSLPDITIPDGAADIPPLRK
jgi:hypothetical protein